MTDGMLDLLSAILVLGIVLAIAFGFILPLVNSEKMDFDAQYEDKGALNNIIDYGNPEEYENLTRRMYTYEELLLLLAVQDSRISGSKTINFRNLITTVDLGYSGYSSAYPGNGKNNNLDTNFQKKGINYFQESGGLRMSELRYDEVYQGFIRWGDNSYTTIDDVEQSIIEGLSVDVVNPNIVSITIDDTFDVTNLPILNELNGSEVINLEYIEDGDITLAPHENMATRLSTFNDIISPLDNKEKYEGRKIYFVSYHFAIPQDSKYIRNLTQYHRNDVLQPMYFIEIKGDNLRLRKNGYSYSDYNGTFDMSLNMATYPSKSLDTWSEYQDYLRQLRKNINAGL